MLPLKQGFCPLCDDKKLKPLISGLCRVHYWGGLRAETKGPTRSPRILTPIEMEQDELQEQWYTIKVKGLSGWCAECGTRIPTWNYRLAKACVAHILPKDPDLFPSIAVHDLNYLELGAGCGCHGRWDLSWGSARKMKIFPLALERFNVFYPDIALAERRKIPDIFFLHQKA